MSVICPRCDLRGYTKPVSERVLLQAARRETVCTQTEVRIFSREPGRVYRKLPAYGQPSKRKMVQSSTVKTENVKKLKKAKFT